MDATKLANELIDLHQHPRQIPPFSVRYPGLTPESGYAAARGLHAHRLAQGWKLLGRKNGFTNRGIWERYGVDGPMWDQGIGANVLDSPLLSLAFLVEILANQKESPSLEAGEIVSTGTLTDAHPVQTGERWSTDLHGFAARGLEIEFT